MNSKLTRSLLISSALLLATHPAGASAGTSSDLEARTMPIDDSLFVASGSDIRSISVERLMDASPQAVWEAWTTEDGWKTTYGPDRPELKANIELAVGGKYEWLFDGNIGSNDCQVLSYLPPRMLSFSWNAPVALAQTRSKRTWMVIEIEPGDNGKSLVRATQLGFGAGPDWDQTKDYFEQGWAIVLDRMAEGFARQ